MTKVSRLLAVHHLRGVALGRPQSTTSRSWSGSEGATSSDELVDDLFTPVLSRRVRVSGAAERRTLGYLWSGHLVIVGPNIKVRFRLAGRKGRWASGLNPSACPAPWQKRPGPHA
jgi:hypothetical protein